jgi:L-threonylcarbamoyladenylate synthase
LNAQTTKPGEFLVGFGDVQGDANLSTSGDLIEAAARLFELLHEADASAQPKIAVAPIREDGIGSAINDRLRRAAHPR